MKRFLIIWALLVCGSSFAAMVDFHQEVVPGAYYNNVAGTLSSAATTLDAVDEKLAFVVQWDSTETITGIAIQTNATTTGGPIFADLQTVSTGVPTGIQLCASSSQTINFVNADDTVTKEVTFVDTCLPVYNSTFSVVLKFPSGSAYNGSLAASFTDAVTSGFPYYVSSTTTAGWAKSTGGPNLMFKISGGNGYHMPKGCSFMPVAVTSTTNSATATRYGNKLIPGYGGRSTGAYLYFDPDGPAEFQLRNGTTGDVLRTCMVSSQTVASNAGDEHIMNWQEGPLTFTSTQTFFLMAVPLSATNISLYANTFTSQAFHDAAMPGAGTIHRVEVPTASIGTPGSYINWKNSRFHLFMMIDQIEVGGSGGASAYGFVGP